MNAAARRRSQTLSLGMILALVALVMLLFGCDQQAGTKTAPATAPAHSPTVDRPAGSPTTSSSSAATTEPATVIAINGRQFAFPAARLKLENNGDHLVALLYSDDPPAALKDDYDGNSFFLQMELDVDDPAELGKATWRYKSRSSERDDSPYGVFLHGRRIQLTPFDVRGGFTNLADESKTATVNLAGHFLMTSENEKGLPQTAGVTAQIPAAVDASKAQPAVAKD